MVTVAATFVLVTVVSTMWRADASAFATAAGPSTPHSPPPAAAADAMAAADTVADEEHTGLLRHSRAAPEAFLRPGSIVSHVTLCINEPVTGTVVPAGQPISVAIEAVMLYRSPDAGVRADGSLELTVFVNDRPRSLIIPPPGDAAEVGGVAVQDAGDAVQDVAVVGDRFVHTDEELGTSVETAVRHTLEFCASNNFSAEDCERLYQAVAARLKWRHAMTMRGFAVAGSSGSETVQRVSTDVAADGAVHTAPHPNYADADARVRAEVLVASDVCVTVDGVAHGECFPLGASHPPITLSTLTPGRHVLRADVRIPSDMASIAALSSAGPIVTTAAEATMWVVGDCAVHTAILLPREGSQVGANADVVLAAVPPTPPHRDGEEEWYAATRAVTHVCVRISVATLNGSALKDRGDGDIACQEAALLRDGNGIHMVYDGAAQRWMPSSSPSNSATAGGAHAGFTGATRMPVYRLRLFNVPTPMNGSRAVTVEAFFRYGVGDRDERDCGASVRVRIAADLASDEVARVAAIPLVVITGVSEAFVDKLENLVASIQFWQPDVDVDVYDLGLSQQSAARIRNWRGVRAVVRLPFDDLPPHVSDLTGTYSFKPLALNHSLTVHERVLWLDANFELRRPLDDLRRALDADGHFFVAQGQTGMTPARWPTVELDHNGTLAWLQCTAPPMSRAMCAGGLQAYVRGSWAHTTILAPLVECALERDCIAPEGSQRLNHRQDQTALNSIMCTSNVHEMCHTEPQWIVWTSAGDIAVPSHLVHTLDVAQWSDVALFHRRNVTEPLPYVRRIRSRSVAKASDADAT